MNILFLCTGNSCRSQMAEGCGRHLGGSDLHFDSAGIEAHGQNPRAIQVMDEAGIDIRGQTRRTRHHPDIVLPVGTKVVARERQCGQQVRVVPPANTVENTRENHQWFLTRPEPVVAACDRPWPSRNRHCRDPQDP